MKSSRSIERAIGRVGDLPPMPEVVAEVLRATSDPDVAMSEVSRVIEKDPALTAKLLKVSNSPYYGMKQVVGTLKLALVILGVREVRNIVLGISVVESLKDSSTERLLNQLNFWDHSVKVAGFAKKLGTHLRLNLQGEDFIAGLLHDIGKMVLWRQMKEKYERIFDQGDGHSEALCKLEKEAFGFDHADAAAVLAKRWNMPDTLADALWFHHDREDRTLADAKDPKLAALTRVANLAIRDDWTTEDVSSLRSCTDEDSWAVIAQDNEVMNVEERARLLSEFYEELNAVSTPSF